MPPTLELYECKSDNNLYPTFEADYSGVTQVCPARKGSNYSPDGFQSSGPLYIVIHNTGNADATAIQGNIRRFQDQTSGVSAHYIVGLNKNGGVEIIQMVDEAYMAHHAGVVIQLDKHNIDNSNSIGIEIVGQGDLKGWPEEKIYAAVAELVKDTVRRAKEKGRQVELDRSYIVGHEEISLSGKWDPGQYWNWQFFMEDQLGSSYEHVAILKAERNFQTNEINLSMMTRFNGRNLYQIEISQDEGPYQILNDIHPNPIKNSVNKNLGNPSNFKLTSYIPSTPEHPFEVCYRAIALRSNVAYVNPSQESCIILGFLGEKYDLSRRDAVVVSQNAFPIVKPGQEVLLAFKLRNTGILSWKNGGQYVFINTGDENFGLETRLEVPQQVWTNEEVTFSLKFKAPQVGAYTTRWQMAYINPQTNSIELFGKETGGVVTVLKDGNTGDLSQIIQNIIDNTSQSVNQTLEDYIIELQRRIQEELDRQFRNWVINTFPCLAPLVSLITMGSFFRGQKRQRS